MAVLIFTFTWPNPITDLFKPRRSRRDIFLVSSVRLEPNPSFVCLRPSLHFCLEKACLPVLKQY